jgi:mannose-1-phosphate guanylyltransferase/phosphomannomutase
MVSIGPKPVLQYIIESLAQQHFDDITITTNYLQEQVENYFGDGSRFGVTLRYPKEEKALGTAGSVRNAGKCLDETFAVIQGDNITDISMTEQLEAHKAKKALVTLVVVPVDEPWKYGVVTLGKDNKVTGFQEKPLPQQCESKLANTGLYIIEPDVLEIIPEGKEFDFARDVFPRILDMKKPLYGYKAKGFWRDVGNVEGLLEASEWLLRKLGHSISRTADITKAEISGMAWIGDEAALETGVKIEGPVYIENSCTIRRDALLNSGTILKRGVNIGDHSRLNATLVFESAEIHSKVTLSRCILDKNCEVGSNAVIEPSAIIGADCKIGENAVICKDVKLEPGARVERGKVIRS